MSNFSTHNFANQKALIRVDFNVPIKKGVITDDTRMTAALPTIKKVLADGGSVVLMSHWGRPIKDMEKKPELTKADFTLKPGADHLSKLLGTDVKFAEDCIGDDAAAKAKNLKPGEVLLLENLRYYKEEEKGDKDFAEKLSKYGDIYVNDAFGTAHRAHASTAVIAQFFPGDKKMFGLLMEGEVAAAEKVMHANEKPFVAIIGGAMAYTFFKAEGGKIGNSLCEDDRMEMALELLKKADEKGVSIHLPADSIIADKFAADANTSSALSNEIPDGWMGLDISVMACEQFSKVISEAKTILWNGPMGVFEMEKFQHGTKSIANAVVAATAKGAFSLVGGGDSVAAVNKFGLADKVSYVSTGGGAMLEYFEGKELPGIAAIKQK